VIWADVQRAFGLTSRRIEGGTEHPTQFTDLEIAIGYRFAIQWEERELLVSPRIGFHSTSFSLGAANDGTREPFVPDVSYPSLTAGIEARVALKPRIWLDVNAGYLAVLDRGGTLDSEPYFPKGGAYGLDLGAGFSLRVAEGVDLRLGATYLRYSLSFDPVPGAVRVAEGASDDTIKISTGLRIVR
jgi:hypothetical protein